MSKLLQLAIAISQMKRLIVLLLSVIILLCLVACGNNDAANNNQGTPSSTGSTTSGIISETKPTGNETNDTPPTIGGENSNTEQGNNEEQHVHTYKQTIIEPTCEKDGFTSYSCDCGAQYTDDVVITQGHIFGNWVEKTAATETTVGKEERKCNNCDKTESRDIPKLVADHTHDYTSSVTKEATCQDEGIKTFACSCGATYTESIGVIPHNYNAEIVKPTCTAAGYTKHTCNCGKIYYDDTVNPIPHNYSAAKTPATCADDGYTTYTCKDCKYSYVGDKVSAKGHDYKDTVTKPTCTNDGYTTHACKTCGHNYVDSKTNATGHKYVNNICSVCNHISVPEGYTAIYTKEQLSNLSPNGKYILICDIDLEGAKWTPIGTETSPFKGTFDGNGYTISNFTISTSYEKLGLFGYNTGVIKNLSVNNFVFEINRSISNIGGLVGYNKGTIENCHVQGYITAKAFVSRDSAGRYGAGIVVGGLAGYNFHGNVYNSSAAVNIFAESEGGKQGTNEVSIYAEAGGLVGSNYGIIQNCTSSGSVEAIAISTATGYEGLKVVASGEAGGLVGSNMIGAKIINCYSTGEVKATSIVGGLVAENNGNIENCFSSIIVSASQGYENKIKFAGGVVGKNGVGSVNNSYYYNAQTISGINSIGSPLDIKTLKSYEFQVQTLGWSSDSWEFKNGYFPALK